MNVVRLHVYVTFAAIGLDEILIGEQKADINHRHFLSEKITILPSELDAPRVRVCVHARTHLPFI